MCRTVKAFEMGHATTSPSFFEDIEYDFVGTMK
jgi:hypothetical protein